MSMKWDNSVQTYGEQSSSTQTDSYQNRNVEQSSSQLNHPIFSINKSESQVNHVAPSQNISTNFEYDEDVSTQKQISADDTFLTDIYKVYMRIVMIEMISQPDI